MKKIHLKEFHYGEKSRLITKLRLHSVGLGNGLTFRFSSIRDLRAFLAETSRFLNIKVYELNEIFIEVLSNYRRAWFYLNPQEDQKIKNSIQGIERAFNSIISRHKDYYVFLDFSNICRLLIEILIILISIKKKRNNHLDTHLLHTVISRITFIEGKIKGYGQGSKYLDPSPLITGPFLRSK